MIRLLLSFAFFHSTLIPLCAETARQPTQVGILAVIEGFDVDAAVGRQGGSSVSNNGHQLPKATVEEGEKRGNPDSPGVSFSCGFQQSWCCNQI